MVTPAAAMSAPPQKNPLERAVACISVVFRTALRTAVFCIVLFCGLHLQKKN